VDEGSIEPREILPKLSLDFLQIALGARAGRELIRVDHVTINLTIAQ
jgi:hypothetical protein